MQKINFNAGPAQLPPEVLHEAAQSVKQYKKTGLSILELPHRGKDFLEILEESKALIRKLCGIGDEYEILWLQGGGRLQFCMIPMNFLSLGKTAGYIDSGHWAHDAAGSAKYYGNVQFLSSSRNSNYNHLPEWPAVPAQLAYLHITTNNTIYGTQWHNIPQTEVPLVADMSSDIFSVQMNYSKFSLYYAAAQKNLGAAGVALAVIRKDFLETVGNNMPSMLSYKDHVKENSVLNTANVFGVYVSLLMLRWIDSKGIQTIERENRKKVALLYEIIDNNPSFVPYITNKSDRSLMNVCFTAATPEKEKALLDLCEKNNITGVKGHRSVGGFRVSLYNAVTFGQVEELVAVMKEV